jgi:hypothetical protein
MQPCSDLRKLHFSLRGRIRRVRALTARARITSGHDRRIFTSHCVIELDNLIINGLRYFVGSCLTKTRTTSGRVVTASMKFNNQEEVGAHILSVLNGTKYLRQGSPTTISRRDEPTLRNPRDLQRVLASVSASNMVSVQNALALNYTVFDEIAPMRNFYAHRNASTFDRARRTARTWGIVQMDHVDEIAVKSRPLRPVPILDDWLSEVQIFMDELMR